VNQPAQTSQTTPARRPGLLARLLLLPLHLFGLLCGALLLALTLHGLGTLLFWPQQGGRHANELAQKELAAIQVAFPRSLLSTEPTRSAQQLDDTLQYWLLQRSGLNARLNVQQAHASTPKHPPIYTKTALVSTNTDLVYTKTAVSPYTQHGFQQHINQASQWLTNTLLAAAHTIRIFTLRLLILTLTLPLFLAAATLGLVDGLVRRDQRRFGAGQESGFVYHRAKASLEPLAVWPCMLWLALPISLPPLALLLPSAVLQGFALGLTASRFKKSL